MAQVNLTVNGRVYRMACDDGEEAHVEALGTRFDGAITELRDALGEIGDQRLMVMAGILMTDRLDDAERRLQRVEQELRDLQENRRGTLARFDSLEENFVDSIEDAAARIERLAERIHANPSLPDDIGA
jgi:cell division protein ZapA